MLTEERTASGGMTGLEDFYRMVQTIRRNRDVVGSTLRGLANLRPLAGFQVIEEEIMEQKKTKEREVLPAETLVGDDNG